MSEHDIKKYIKLLKKFNSGDSDFEETRLLYDMTDEIKLYIEGILATWD